MEVSGKAYHPLVLVDMVLAGYQYLWITYETYYRILSINEASACAWPTHLRQGDQPCSKGNAYAT